MPLGEFHSVWMFMPFIPPRITAVTLTGDCVVPLISVRRNVSIQTSLSSQSRPWERGRLAASNERVNIEIL